MISVYTFQELHQLKACNLSFVDARHHLLNPEANYVTSPKSTEQILAELENIIILLAWPPTFCIGIVSCFSCDLQWSQEKTKTMLIQNLGEQTKSIMVFFALANWQGFNNDMLNRILRFWLVNDEYTLINN